ncbi:pseudouridine synthase [Azoarcus indigens]|uniref:Pseudouridine synthase n=1 Tax=Azoarcus indigens TaxID=29545 RepID=A0A4R6DS27_9RHOO|nr:16S rRNA pseudouridine(516) synthase [Azoarcus indigens]NMG65269.1 pseudouridine synthase [Azoarcus indigens]TDN47915.1 ribosomal small subunit pseudouridine synthase A [Azoarcus indigens]
MPPMQLERLLHSQGFGSRKQCRALIRAGLVSVAGEPCENPFQEVEPGGGQDLPGLAFSVDGQAWHYRQRACLMLHKPAGYECSHLPTHHPSVFSLLPPELKERGVQCIGRLDQDTTGLLLLSDDGQFIHQWSSGKKRIPKRYRVTLKHAVEDSLVQALLDGVQLHDEPAPIAAAACEVTGSHTLALTICEGKYHQVKRMVAAAGNRVEALQRESVGGLVLDVAALPEGQWRWLTPADLQQLADFG